MTNFAERLEQRGVLLADGATGTNFQNMGIAPGVTPEEWVLDAPDNVIRLHRAFVEAGSDLALTCTFGASSLRLADTPLAGRTEEVNRRAVELARGAVGDDALVGGSLGPTGQLVEPLGPLGRDECIAAYAEQAAALVADDGLDVLVLETFFALDEGLWALQGIRESTDLPVIVSYSFDQGTRTMMGLGAADVVGAFASLGVAAIGANCGRSLEDNSIVVDEFLATGMELPLWIKPNAGVPRVVGDAVVYEEDPESMGAKVAEFAARGARIVGGCCGSTPEHIAAIAAALGRA